MSSTSSRLAPLSLAPHHSPRSLKALEVLKPPRQELGRGERAWRGGLGGEARRPPCRCSQSPGRVGAGLTRGLLESAGQRRVCVPRPQGSWGRRPSSSQQGRLLRPPHLSFLSPDHLRLLLRSS